MYRRPKGLYDQFPFSIDQGRARVTISANGHFLPDSEVARAGFQPFFQIQYLQNDRPWKTMAIEHPLFHQ